MQHWDLNSTDGAGGAADPRILTSGEEGRAVLLDLSSGQSLDEHQVHEKAWIVIISGEVDVSAGGERVSAGAGHMFEFEPGERREVSATGDAKVLLLLVPWPGAGHPGAMTLEEKASVRERAAAHENR